MYKTAQFKSAQPFQLSDKKGLHLESDFGKGFCVSQNFWFDKNCTEMERLSPLKIIITHPLKLINSFSKKWEKIFFQNVKRCEPQNNRLRHHATNSNDDFE